MKTRIKVPAEIFTTVPTFIRRDVLMNMIIRQVAAGHHEVYKSMAQEVLANVTRDEYKNEWKSVSISIDAESSWNCLSEVDRLACILAAEYMMMNLNLEVCL